jgi:peptide/nickel transport system ATP-binding protein
MTTPLLDVRGLHKTFVTGGRTVAALDDVSLALSGGETLGLVGPSGSGKSTLARVLLRLIEPDDGAIIFDGVDWLALAGATQRAMRKRIQMVFQDPLAALNPRATVSGALGDPLRIHGIVERTQRPAAIARLLERVGLDPALARRAIHEISGGQRQRVAIARALATNPDLIVLDEPVSALDVSVRGQILDLLVGLQRERGMAYLFVSHDLAVVRAVSHRIAIMDAGRIVEAGPAARVVAEPESKTGRALIAAVPRLNLQDVPRADI